MELLPIDELILNFEMRTDNQNSQFVKWNLKNSKFKKVEKYEIEKIVN